MVADDPEGCSDAYVRAFFDSREEVKETDTHYRCSDGKASWNYRLIFNLKHPRKDYDLSLQVYDRDLLTSNDVIGETTFCIKEALLDASLTKKPVTITKKYWENYLKDTKSQKKREIKFFDENTFWLECMGGAASNNGKLVCQGKLRIQIDILPKE